MVDSHDFERAVEEASGGIRRPYSMRGSTTEPGTSFIFKWESAPILSLTALDIKAQRRVAVRVGESLNGSSEPGENSESERLKFARGKYISRRRSTSPQG